MMCKKSHRRTDESPVARMALLSVQCLKRILQLMNDYVHGEEARKNISSFNGLQGRNTNSKRTVLSEGTNVTAPNTINDGDKYGENGHGNIDFDETSANNQSVATDTLNGSAGSNPAVITTPNNAHKIAILMNQEDTIANSQFVVGQPVRLNGPELNLLQIFDLSDNPSQLILRCSGSQLESCRN
ncbi:hypothetical protein IMSHALPRED_000732 [Imshaugia aleurites]|uniref:Uncharacterized protein n=1 Tax=Imshaugia aleurites TaxID=172621 RepID=A0A8H3IYC5_9LECA|nr:hypothetical protein IMSHALPRED_000732 [Imshaugia aleurites]